jgi:hypothetical protein
MKLNVMHTSLYLNISPTSKMNFSKNSKNQSQQLIQTSSPTESTNQLSADELIRLISDIKVELDCAEADLDAAVAEMNRTFMHQKKYIFAKIEALQAELDKSTNN